MSDQPDPRFDAALTRAARSLVTDELPDGLLDAGLAPTGAFGGVQARRSVPALAGFAAGVVLLLAIAIALAPGGAPPRPPTPAPSPSASVTPGVFRSTLDMRADYMQLRYACAAGNPLPSVAPGSSAAVREGVVCTAPSDAGPYISAVIVSEAADGDPVDVHVKADLTIADTPQARREIAVPLAKAAAISASGQDAGNELAQWVLATVPTLEPGKAARTEIRGFSLQLVRNANGGYQLFVDPA